MAKEKYICSSCGKLMLEDTMPSSCPQCGAAGANIQRSEERIPNDEMAITLRNLGGLLKMLDDYVDKVKGLNSNFEQRVKTLQHHHASQLKNCTDKHSQELSNIDSERTRVLEGMDKEYKRVLESESKMADAIKKEEADTIRSASQYRDNTVQQVQNGKKHLESIMSSLQAAEAHIVVKKYHKLVKAGETPAVSIAATKLNDISALNPMHLANELNSLYEKFIRRVIKASVINRKINEFYAIRVNAQRFYQQELAELEAKIPTAMSKASNMTSEANRRFRDKMADHDAHCKESKGRYIKACTETRAKYDKQRDEALRRQAQQKSELLSQHQHELEILDQEKKTSLLESYKSMQTTALSKFPPQAIADAVRCQKSRSKALRNSFKLATNEPENITVGSLEYKLDRILGNRLVSKFMVDNYKAIINGTSFVFPFTIGLNQNLCLLFKYENNHAALAKDHIQTICLTAFLETPPNKMRFHFFDPLKSGQSFAIFKHFEDDLARSYNVILGGIQTDSASIEQQLQIVVDQIKTMQINTFKGQYKNIREYNAANPLNPQPYNIVGIMDFPAGFTAKSMVLLQQIVATGKECGVYAIIMYNSDSVKAADNQVGGLVKNIENLATVYILKQKGYYLEEKSGGIDENMIFTIDSPLSVQKIVEIAPIMKQGIKDAGRIVIDYKHISPPETRQFQYSTDEGLVIPIGMSGASNVQYLTLGQPGSQSVHALIAGQIGSGKSRLLHAIITSSILQYSEGELEIYLVDFKSGTEFKIYADYCLPNFKVIAIESEQEFGLSVLQYIEKESQRRAQLFNNSSVSDITSYNGSCSASRNGKLPRILVVIDEFHELFNSANSDASAEASRLLDKILRLKRSFGVHVILCTQSVRGMSEVNEAAMAQIAVRIALKCPKEDADILLGAGSDAMAQIEENDAGSAVYLPAISTPKTNNRFRVGYISPEAHVEILKRIESHYAGQDPSGWNTRVLVSDVADSRDSVFQEYVKRDCLTVDSSKLHFGESLNIDKTIAIAFEPRKNENMLLAGKDSQKAENLLFFITLDLVLQKVKAIKLGLPVPNIYVFNFNEIDDVITKRSLQEMVMLLPDYIEAATSQNAVERLAEIFSIYNKPDRDAPIWVIISNFGLASGFQSSIYNSSSQGFSMLEELLQNGPQKMIYTIGWADDLTLFRQKYPNLIDMFKKRIAFNLSDEEALNFADVVKDPSLNKNNAVFFEYGRGKQKFRPYSAPSDSWFNEVINKITSEDII